MVGVLDASASTDAEPACHDLVAPVRDYVCATWRQDLPPPSVRGPPRACLLTTDDNASQILRGARRHQDTRLGMEESGVAGFLHSEWGRVAAFSPIGRHAPTRPGLRPKTLGGGKGQSWGVRANSFFRQRPCPRGRQLLRSGERTLNLWECL